ncbi:MAG: hypothetical protein KDJ41_13520, partial [Hyphomicrobiaceae bacterium]|nr:hypothetical protein [Hyphomicrobiaceae bacterium]
HLAQQIGIRRLFQVAAHVHHVVGHRWFSGPSFAFRNPILSGNSGDHRKPFARYSARLRAPFANGFTVITYTTPRDIIGNLPVEHARHAVPHHRFTLDSAHPATYSSNSVGLEISTSNTV